MTTRRLASAFFALTLPLAVAACSNEENTLAEPELNGEAGTATEEAEPVDDQSSTTVSTVYETETAAAKDKPAPATKKKPDKGPCEWVPVEQGQFGDEVYNYCDGRFASVGIYGTDAVGSLFWNGDDWEHIEEAGQTYTGFRCYDEAHLDELGAPSAFKEEIILCE